MSLRLRLTVLTGLLTVGTVLLFALAFYLVQAIIKAIRVSVPACRRCMTT